MMALPSRTDTSQHNAVATSRGSLLSPKSQCLAGKGNRAFALSCLPQLALLLTSPSLRPSQVKVPSVARLLAVFNTLNTRTIRRGVDFRRPETDRVVTS